VGLRAPVRTAISQQQTWTAAVQTWCQAPSADGHRLSAELSGLPTFGFAGFDGFAPASLIGGCVRLRTLLESSNVLLNHGSERPSRNHILGPGRRTIVIEQ
jgi:hypothetical protein